MTDAEKLYFSALFSEGGVYRSADMKKREKRRQRRAVRFAAGSLVDEFGEPVTYAKGNDNSETRGYARSHSQTKSKQNSAPVAHTLRFVRNI